MNAPAHPAPIRISRTSTSYSRIASFLRVSRHPPRVGVRPRLTTLATIFGVVTIPYLQDARDARAQSAEVEETRAAGLAARSEEGGVQELPLIREAVRVRIDEQYADAEYEHQFQNESTSRLEGTYRLRVGEGATASGFAYWNGNRKIVGEVFEKETAQSIYEEVSGMRRDPGLLEQIGEGAFSFRVFPIEPGETKRVQVQAGRWLPERAGSIEYRTTLMRSDARVEIDIADARGLGAVESPTHDLSVTGDLASGKAHVSVTGAKATANGELILRYRSLAPAWTVHATVHRDKGQDAFVSLALAAPVVPASPSPPRDVTIVIDRSGSMGTDSMESAKAAALRIVDKLRPEDAVNVLDFDDNTAALFSEPRPVTGGVRKEAQSYIKRLAARGGTDIAGALKKALASQRKDERPDMILFMTDGQSDGPAAVKIAQDDTHDVRLFTVGIGDGVDKALLNRLATLKHGRFTFVSSARSLEAELTKLYGQFEDPVLTDVSVMAEGARLERAYPTALSDLFPNDELRLSGRLVGSGKGKLIVKGRAAGVPKTWEIAFDLAAAESAPHPWAGRLWALSRVDDLLENIRASGESDERKNEAIELGLAYNLVTPYTSFLALPESEATPEIRDALSSARDKKKKLLAQNRDAAALSRWNMPPGDPVLKVRAPRDAQRVTAEFPFGLTSELAYDDFSESWMTRFLVPAEVTDGTYEVIVTIVDATGRIAKTRVAYTIDAKEPGFEVDTRVENDDVMVRVMADEPLQEVRALPLYIGYKSAAEEPRTSGGRALILTRDPDGRTFRGTIKGAAKFGAPSFDVRIVAADSARNESDRVVRVELSR